MPGKIPALRSALEAIPVEKDGQPLFVIRDLEGLTEGSAALSAGGMLLASFFDGTRSSGDVIALFAKATGTVLKAEEVDGMARDLEKAGLLETPAIAERRRAQRQAFLDSQTRPAAHQGTVYPAQPLELSEALGKFFADPKGPGAARAETSDSPAAAGVLFPHIDFPRGGPSYAWAFQALSRTAPPDLIVALGVAHMSPNSPWTLTRKAYQTPYGPMAVDEEGYSAVRDSLWYDPLSDELVHRSEHSLEFAAVWLKYLWKENTPPWVPILTSSFERFCPDAPPSSVETVEKAIEAIGEKLKAIAGRGRRVLILAAVDLAHVGPRFGDQEELTPELFAKIEREDRASLDHALGLAADPFYRSVVDGGHWRKVCGLSASYTALRWIKALHPGASGSLLSYGQAADPMGGVVSFASVLFKQ